MALAAQIGDRLIAARLPYTSVAKRVVDVRDEEERVTSILLRANVGNSGIVYVGDSNSQPFELEAGQSLNIHVTRRSQIFYRMDTAGDFLTVMTVMTSGPAGDRCRGN